MKFRITFYFLILGLMSCGSDEPIELEMGDPNAHDIVTGVRFFDENGLPIGKVGNPNIKNSENLAIYPNPNNGELTVQSFNNNGFEAWLIKANKSLEFVDYDFDSNKPSIEGSILDQQKVVRGNTDLSILRLSMNLLEKGYYRLIVKSSENDELIENIYFDPDMSGNEMIVFLNSEF